MSHRIAVRGRWYWFSLGFRTGFIEVGKRRLVWSVFTVPNEPLTLEQSAVLNPREWKVTPDAE